MKEIQNKLFELSDSKYRDFQCSLIPTVDKDTVIGVRVPILRKMAKGLEATVAERFMNGLPHRYYDENMLQVFLINKVTDIDECYRYIECFLPYVDNWAVCDSLSPKVLKKDKDRLINSVDRWLTSDEIYTVRFAVGMLMRHFLDDDYSVRYSDRVASVASDEYYVNMMCAWYFATAIAKQYDSIIPYFEEGRLNLWVHNKAITKACESFRVAPWQKEYLRTLKRKTAE